MFINVKINDCTIKGLVDTVSEITMISNELASSLGLTIDRQRGHNINGVKAVSVQITVQSKINAKIFYEHNERVVPITVLTVQNFHLKFLLSYDFHYASKSLIDIFNSKIIFDPRATRNRQIISTLHSTNNLERIANCVVANTFTPMNNGSDVSCQVKRKH